jgi:hypothetical protein
VHTYVFLQFQLLNENIDEELHVRARSRPKGHEHDGPDHNDHNDDNDHSWAGEVHEGLEEIKFLSFWHHGAAVGSLLQSCRVVIGIELLLKKLLE